MGNKEVRVLFGMAGPPTEAIRFGKSIFRRHENQIVLLEGFVNAIQIIRRGHGK